ncbi:unnamed protein product [Phytophthora lilii]|uniref:Unnamed protein product n=1 Tax=Phytophthora lilii TaxID=2077276 RepID=A0A9W6TV15_9STRA|nr:unnamed protein product [Phytophthora lilii]
MQNENERRERADRSEELVRQVEPLDVRGVAVDLGHDELEEVVSEVRQRLEVGALLGEVEDDDVGRAPAASTTSESETVSNRATGCALSKMAAMTAAVRVATPEIRLHCGPTGLNEAVLSLDFLRPRAGDETQRPLLATGGADKEIKLWRVGEGEAGAVALDFVFSLSGHDRSVNCVRFSPDGAFLASASDDTSIILWSKPKTAGDDWRWDRIASLSDVARTILSLGHKGDITDLSWSPDSAFLCSSSVDNRCVIWDVDKGDVAERRKDHTQYVQGVAWDPLNEFLVTEGNDRTCRVYSLSGFGAATRPNGKKQSRKFMCIQTLKTREFPSSKSDSPTNAKDGKEDKKDCKTPADAAAEPAAKAPPAPKHRMFLDDTCPAFARRPAWTPDGSYFLAPTGTFRASESASPVNTVYAFSRGNLSQPTLHLPGQEKASLGVRCSPLLYELRRQDGEAGSSPLPNLFQTKYRSVFAVITLDAVVIYDTQVDIFCGSRIRPVVHCLTFMISALVTTASSPDLHDQVALNEGKMRRMFATPKKSRKKPRNQAQAQSIPSEQTPMKILTAKKKQPVTPIARAFQNSDGTTAANPVNLLQVRKKRKISPTLVQPVTTTAPTGGPHAPETSSNTPAINAPIAEGTTVDLTGPFTSEPAPSQPQTQPNTAAEHAGTFDDPLDI